MDKKMKIAFDVDETLITPKNVGETKEDIPNYDVVAIYKWFQDQGCHMIVWSGGGLDWAKRWVEKLGLEPCEIRIKQKSEDVDICFDDMEVDLAKVNIKLKEKEYYCEAGHKIKYTYEDGEPGVCWECNK